MCYIAQATSLTRAVQIIMLASSCMQISVVGPLTNNLVAARDMTIACNWPLRLGVAQTLIDIHRLLESKA